MSFFRRIFFILVIIVFANISTATTFSTNVEKVVRRRIDQVVSVFENNSKAIHYSYIEALDDGRGYTAGKAGFTTGTGDLLVVVERYLKIEPKSDFRKLLPELRKKAQTNSPSLSGLELLPSIWKKEGSKRVFQRIQDEVADELYFFPAVKKANEFNVDSNLGILIVYDTCVQHGPGGYDEIASKVDPKIRGQKSKLLALLDIRYQTLMNPADPSTANEWRDSVGRVFALKKLVLSHNFDLEGPFWINPFGDEFKIY